MGGFALPGLALDTLIADARGRVANLGGDLGAARTALRETAGEAGDALKLAASALGDGARDVTATAVTYAQGDVNRVFETAKSLIKARSLREAIEIQGSFVRTHVEAQLTQVRDLGRRSASVARDAFQPIRETAGSVAKRVRAA